MLINYTYIKPRSQFGKQCFFESTDPIVEENLQPVPKYMRKYIHRTHCHRKVQNVQQLALHEIQTTITPMKNTGMLHLEGGWPAEINVKDEEILKRFRRRVEKDENWNPRISKLTKPMEHMIMQNNTIDIYQHYFDDIEPTSLILSREIKIVNAYHDPQTIMRPVKHLSWSDGVKNRVAASYAFAEFETRPTNVHPYSYIWDIENPITPWTTLNTSVPLMMTEFNPRDPWMLASGLMSGQVCNWDIRIGSRPVQMSHRRFSHRNSANQAYWLASKSNTEFFSGSIDGTVKWWDTRKLVQPTEELVMDLVDPERAKRTEAFSVTALHYEPTMGTRFLVGLQNGLVINVNRKYPNPVHKLANRFNCHFGPVITISRNSFIPKNFLTIGNSTMKIWADDTTEDSLIIFHEQDANLSGGCWSHSRCSVFFIINSAGRLKVYDLMVSVDSPTTVFHVCNEKLTAIACHGNGEHLAVGNHKGDIYLLKCAEAHTRTTKSDKLSLLTYLERCSRFVKIVNAHLREIRLLYEETHEELVPERLPRTKSRIRRESRIAREHRRLKSRLRREIKVDLFIENVAEVETQFYKTVEKEMANYSRLDDHDIARVISLQESMHRRRRRRLTIESKEKKPSILEPVEVKFPLKSPVRRKVKRPKRLVEPEEIKEEEEVEKRIVLKEPVVRRRRRRKVEKVCAIEVCVPEVCCADGKLEVKRKAELQIQKFLEEKDPCKFKQKSKKIDDVLANVVADEVTKAKENLHAWKQTIISRQRDFSQRALRSDAKLAEETSHGTKRKVDKDDDDDAEDFETILTERGSNVWQQSSGMSAQGEVP